MKLRLLKVSRLLWHFILTAMVVSIILPVASIPAAEKQIEKNPLIVVYSEFDYPPYSFRDRKGQPTGYNIELTQAIAEVLGLNIEIRLGVWAEIQEAMEVGKCDVISGMHYSKRRDKSIDFSTPYAIVHYAIFGRLDSPKIESEKELRGKEIIVIRGDIMHDYAQEKGLSENLVLVETQTEALRLLASGKHDCALLAKLSGLYCVNELKLSNIVIFGQPILSSHYCYAVKKGNTALLGRFNEGLAILKETNQFRKIYDKWFGVVEPRGIPINIILRYAIPLLSPLLLLLLFSLLWSQVLRRQVAQRTMELKAAQSHIIRSEKLAAIGKLASIMSHEIRNPLGVIKNSIYFLNMKLEKKMDKEIEKHLDILQTAVNNCDKIISNILDFVHLKVPTLAKVNINHLVKEIFSKVAVPNTVKVQTNLGENLPNVLADVSQIEEVFSNIISNAIQVMPEGGSLIVTTAQIDKFIAVAFQDTGCGILKENLDKIFEPLFSTKAKGVGLGLTTCQIIIEAHRGVIEVESEVNKGTTFTIKLPLA